MKYINDSLTPSEVKQNVSKTYAYLRCRTGLNDNHNIFNHSIVRNQSFRCTWNGTEIYSYTPVVEEKVTCIFSGSTATNNSCTTTVNNKSYACKSIKGNSCKVEVSGKKGTKLTWKSTFGANQETILDGKNKNIVFTNSSVPTTPVGTYKLYLSGSTTPTTTKTNITQDDALTSCMATQSTTDSATSIRCTWNDVEIYAYTAPVIVTSQVTCIFS